MKTPPQLRLIPILYLMVIPALAEDKKSDKSKEVSALLKQTMRSNSIYSITEAVLYKKSSILKARMEEGKNLNEKDESGQTPLHLAAIHKRTSMVALLLNAGADPTLTNNQGKTPIQCTKHKKIVHLLDKALQKREREIELLQHIAANNKQEVAKALKAKINPNAFTQKYGETMLHFAVQQRRTDIVKMLVKAGADVNKKRPDGNTPMHIAAAWGAVDIANILINGGADPTIATPKGSTPLLDAVWHNRPEMIKLLLPYYKDVNYSPEGKGEGYPICMAIKQGKTKLIPLFLNAGINLNDEKFRESPPLIMGVKTNSAEIVNMLLKAGANPNFTDKDGKTAHDYANSTIALLLKS